MSSLRLIASFNAELFGKNLSNREYVTSVVTPPYASFHQEIYNYREEDVSIVWAPLETVSTEYQKAQMLEASDHEAILLQVKSFANQLIQLAESCQTLLVVLFSAPTFDRGYSLLEFKSGLGLRGITLRANALLIETLQHLDNVFLLEAKESTEPPRRIVKNWLVMKSRYMQGTILNLGDQIEHFLGLQKRTAKKLIISDLDNTLWGGVIGDDGVEGIRLGGHDPVGEGFVMVQRYLLQQRNRGVLLAISSKNDEETVRTAFSEHQEMLVSLDDFSSVRINWNDKVQNILSIVDELNIGLDSVVFLDDSDFEKGNVKERLPEVFVPDLGDDVYKNIELLTSLQCFDALALTDEDRQRSELYKSEKKRQKFITETGGSKDYLENLKVEITAEPVGSSNLKRVCQLLNKTNQFNLKTRRWSEAELKQCLEDRSCSFWAFHVGDKFGNLGLVAVISWRNTEDTLVVEDFVLSCRAFGRQIEDWILWFALDLASIEDVSRLELELIPTKKNGPTRTFLDRLQGFESNENLYFLDIDQLPAPTSISHSVKG